MSGVRSSPSSDATSVNNGEESKQAPASPAAVTIDDVTETFPGPGVGPPAVGPAVVAVDTETVAVNTIPVNGVAAGEGGPAKRQRVTAADAFVPMTPYRLVHIPPMTVHVPAVAAVGVPESSPLVTGPCGSQWRLLVYPTGDQLRYADQISVFVDQRHWPQDIVVDTRIEFRLEPIAPPATQPRRQMMNEKAFDGTFPNWGKPGWMSVKDMEEEGYMCPTTRQVKVSCLIYCTDVTRKFSFGYRTPGRAETGMTGILNQGATCYMNSLLQTLFHTRLFRKVVYEVPINASHVDDSGKGSCVRALQTLFLDMQQSSGPVSTEDLTTSFGWDPYQAFQQHDVQELLRVMLDEVERLMQKSVMELCVAQLLQGVMVTTIKCDNVDYASHRKEQFFDVQLTVKGCKDIYESLNMWIADDRLDGDNKYHAGEHGKQDATKFVRFVELPPVLHIQLKRFEFDMQTMGMAKVNTPFAFPEVLDLAPYVAEAPPDDPPAEDGGDAPPPPADADDAMDTPAPATPSAAATADLAAAAAAKTGTRYLLHSVLVHSGGVHGGHYYAFVRPKLGRDGGVAPAAAAPRAPEDTMVEPEPAAGAGATEGGGGDRGLTYDPASLFGDELPPAIAPEWFKFDDTHVYPATTAEAMDDNFGTEATSAYGGYYSTSGTNAYMLVYMKESALAEVMFEDRPAAVLDAQDEAVRSYVPPGAAASPASALLGTVEDGKEEDGKEADNKEAEGEAVVGLPPPPAAAEEEEEQPPSFVDVSMAVPRSMLRRLQEERDALLRMTIYVARERDVALMPRLACFYVSFSRNQPERTRLVHAMDWVDGREGALTPVTVLRTDTMAAALPKVGAALGVPADRLRAWRVYPRENGTYRPMDPVVADSPEGVALWNSTIAKLFKSAPTAQGPMLYVQEFPEGEALPIPAPQWLPAVDTSATAVCTARSGFRDGDGPFLLFRGQPIVVDGTGILPGDLCIPEVAPRPLDPSEILFMFWLFVPGAPTRRRCVYMGSPVLPSSMTTAALHTLVCRWLGVEDDAAVELYELYPSATERLAQLEPSAETTLHDASLVTGDVIWVQPTFALPPEALELPPLPQPEPEPDATEDVEPPPPAYTRSPLYHVKPWGNTMLFEALIECHPRQPAAAAAIARMSTAPGVSIERHGEAPAPPPDAFDGVVQCFVPRRASVADAKVIIATAINARLNGRVPPGGNQFDDAVAASLLPEPVVESAPVDPAYLRLTRAAHGASPPRPYHDHIVEAATRTINAAIAGKTRRAFELSPIAACFLFYEVMPRPVAELEAAVRLVVRWLGCEPGLRESYGDAPAFAAAGGDGSPAWDGIAEVEVHVAPTASVADLHAELRQVLRLPPALRLRSSLYTTFGLDTILVDEDAVVDVAKAVADDTTALPHHATSQCTTVVVEPVAADEPPLPTRNALYSAPLQDPGVEWVLFGQHTERAGLQLSGRAYLVPVTQATTLKDVVLPTLKRMGKSLDFMRCKGRGLSAVCCRAVTPIDFDADGDVAVASMRSLFPEAAAGPPPPLPALEACTVPEVEEVSPGAAPADADGDLDLDSSGTNGNLAAVDLRVPDGMVGPEAPPALAEPASTPPASPAVTQPVTPPPVTPPPRVDSPASARSPMGPSALHPGGDSAQRMLAHRPHHYTPSAFSTGRALLQDDPPLSQPHRVVPNVAMPTLPQPAALRAATANVWHRRQLYWTSVPFARRCLHWRVHTQVPYLDHFGVEQSGVKMGAVLLVGISAPMLLPVPVLSIRQLDASEAIDLTSPRPSGRAAFFKDQPLTIAKWDKKRKR